MDALLKPSSSVLANHTTIRGIGCGEIGHEYRASPDPSMAFTSWFSTYPLNSTLILRETVAGGGTEVRVTFNGLPGGTYQVQYSNGLATTGGWQALATVTPDAQGQVQVIDPPPLPPRRFYRIEYP